MKKLSFLVVCAVFLIVVGAGCASPIPVGVVYSDIKLPYMTTNRDSKIPLKIGIAKSKSYFGVVAVGDSSIEKAAKNGKIKKIHYIDWKVENICGVTNYKIIVYGE